VLSVDEESFLLVEVKRLPMDNQTSFALGALAESSIPDAELVIASYLEQSQSSRMANDALRALCIMGLCQKYRHNILQALYHPSPDKEYPYAAVTAVGCMGRCLREHKDQEFAEILIGFILAEERLPSAASKESS